MIHLVSSGSSSSAGGLGTEPQIILTCLPPGILLLIELITAATPIPFSATICSVLAVAHLNWPVLSYRSVSLLGFTSTIQTGSTRLLIRWGELHTHLCHLLLICALAPQMRTDNNFDRIDFCNNFDFTLLVLGIDVSAADSGGSFSLSFHFSGLCTRFVDG